YESLVTRQLIFVQDFAFRGRPVSLLVTYAPGGSHLFRFSRKSLRLALQSQARSNYRNETFVHSANKKSERVGFSIKNLHSSFGFPFN
ncbi:hypothetical protein V7170_07185, partial [Priestia megaterium]|uniref:hypothetical protein n=1 Tax=Priestia megaterium TaxID=1404 RepID=UPI00300B8E9E